jgi:hypothetical protein
MSPYLPPAGERGTLLGRLAPEPATPSDCALMTKSPSRETARNGLGDARPPTRPDGAASFREMTLLREDPKTPPPLLLLTLVIGPR